MGLWVVCLLTYDCSIMLNIAYNSYLIDLYALFCPLSYVHAMLLGVGHETPMLFYWLPFICGFVGVCCWGVVAYTRTRMGGLGGLEMGCDGCTEGVRAVSY